MELKMTERDKILLIVLLILLIVFGAVMFPTWGIMASVQSIIDNNKAIVAQKADNVDMLEQMQDKGISAAYAENAAQADRQIKRQILQVQYDAIKNSQMCLSADSTSVARDWLTPLAYVNYENGTDADKLLNDIQITGNANGYGSEQLLLDSISYAVSDYSCSLLYATLPTAYNFELEYSEVSNAEIASIILGYNLLTERGSVYIKTEPNVMRQTGASASWTLDLVVPSNSAISAYKSEVCECHECGEPYSKLEYDTETAEIEDEATGAHYVKHCDNCDAILTGDTLE